jgi:tetratricopeptide (TPR) repeat protein
MRKYKLPLLLGLLLAGIISVWLLPAILRKLPTRYAMRLPEPLQALALPADPTPILPTIAAPEAAAGLLAGTVPPPAIVTSAPPPSPTPWPVSGALETTVTPAATATSEANHVAPTATAWPVPAAARMSGFTHVYQEWNNCGPATMVMALTYFGRVHSQRDTAQVLRPNQEDRNVTPQEMAAFVNSQDGLRSIARVNGDLNLLKRLLANNIPVIIEIGFDPPGEYQWLGWYGHYLLPVAYDDASSQVWVYDSWLGTSEIPQTNADPNGRVLTYDELESIGRNLTAPTSFSMNPNKRHWSMNYWARRSMTRPCGKPVWTALSRRRQDEGNAFYWFNLGTTYNALGQFDKAALAFDQARAIGLPWRMLWYQFGPYEAYYQTGRFDDIVLLADSTLQDRPYFEESFYYLGLAQAGLGDYTSARENLEKARAFNPNFAEAAQALTELASPGG